MEEGKCNECGEPASKKCAGCGSVFYCSIDHQKSDWASHKLYCKMQRKGTTIGKAKAEPAAEIRRSMTMAPSKPTKPLLDQELKAGESTGTFRWRDMSTLQQLPKFHYTMLPAYSTKWQEFISVRLEDFVKGDTLSIQPITIDALSWPMTIVNSMKILEKQGFKLSDLIKDKRRLNIFVMGATHKAEERIYCASKGYFQQVINYFPGLLISYYFVGPEISQELHQKQFYMKSRVEATFYKGKMGEFMAEAPEGLEVNNSLFIGFNPGFGCGYQILAWSWVQDILPLLQKKYYVVFTQANDFEDVKGETKMLKEIVGAKFIQAAQENPFRAISHLHEEGKQDTKWMCANSFYYIVQGFNKKGPKREGLRERVYKLAKSLQS